MEQFDWTIYRMDREAPFIAGHEDQLVTRSTGRTASDAVKAAVKNIPGLAVVHIYDGPYHARGLYMTRRPAPDVPLLYAHLSFADTDCQFDGGTVLVVEENTGKVIKRGRA